MKKKFWVFLLGGMMTMTTPVLACIGDDDEPDDNPEKWRSPANHPRAYINYDEASDAACVHFLSIVNNAEIIVYQDGTEVDIQVVDAVKGTQVPLYLPTYGNGDFNIQVKSSSTLIAIYYITL